MVKSSMFVTLLVGTAICLAACHGPQSSEKETPVEAATVLVADKGFVAGGKVDIDLDGGGYEIRPAGDNHIRVAVSGAADAVKVDVAVDANQANVKIKNTPHNNFHAIVEVPSAADVVVRLTGGELKMGAI